jgi:YfiH family protein
VLDVLPAGLPAPAAGAFTGRAGGVSAPPYDALNLGMHVEDEQRRVHANRALVASAAGVGADDLVFAEQVHGSGVATVDRSSSRGCNGTVPAVDALVTATPGLGLVVLAADCLPVLLADPVARVVAAAHAGRQGLRAGVLQRTLDAMSALGAQPGRTTAALGPAVCGRCYEVPDAMAAEVEAAVPGSRTTTRAGTAGVDLAAGAVGVLRAAGLRVTEVGGCTLEQPARFFSYRRDGRTGRHAGVVWLAA